MRGVQARADKARADLDSKAMHSSELEREVKRLTEELEQAKEYEGEMVREISDTGEAFAQLQSERAKALELQTASDEKLQAAVRQCTAVRSAQLDRVRLKLLMLLISAARAVFGRTVVWCVCSCLGA